MTMEEQQQRMQREVESMMNSLDKQYLRKMQAMYFKCGAKCAENESLSAHQLQDCVERCQMPLNRANEYLANELENFQSRLQRCAMDCQDSLRDALTSGSASARTKAHEDLEKCAGKCIEKHMTSLPSLHDRLRVHLAEATKSSVSL